MDVDYLQIQSNKQFCHGLLLFVCAQVVNRSLILR